MKYKKPNEDSLGATGYQYLVPIDAEKMADGYYELELISFGLNKEEDKFAAEFMILETNFRIKGKASVLLNPSQKHAETYFWMTLADMRLALSGKDVTPELRKKRSRKYHKGVMKPEDEGGGDQFIIDLFKPLIGSKCRLDLAKYTTKDDNTGLRQAWSPSDGPDESE